MKSFENLNKFDEKVAKIKKINELTLVRLVVPLPGGASFLPTKLD